MPIPTTCPSCGKLVNAPDKFAGKRVKCPQCKTPMEIPASEGSGRVNEAPNKPSNKTTTRLGGKACPNCGRAWAYDDVFCTECGTNLATGKKAKGL